MGAMDGMLWFECEMSPAHSHLNTWSQPDGTIGESCRSLRRWIHAGDICSWAFNFLA